MISEVLFCAKFWQRLKPITPFSDTTDVELQQNFAGNAFLKQEACASPWAA